MAKDKDTKKIKITAKDLLTEPDAMPALAPTEKKVKKSHRWQVTVGNPKNPLVLYHLKSDEPMDAEEAWELYKQQTGRGDPEGDMQKHCLPMDQD